MQMPSLHNSVPPVANGVAGLLRVQVVEATHLPKARRLVSVLLGTILVPATLAYCAKAWTDGVFGWAHLLLTAAAFVCAYQFFITKRLIGLLTGGLVWNNAFVVVSVGATTFKTRVARNGPHPEWNERFAVIVRDAERSFDVKCTVYGMKALAKNKPLGSCSVSLENIVSTSAAREIEDDKGTLVLRRISRIIEDVALLGSDDEDDDHAPPSAPGGLVRGDSTGDSKGHEDGGASGAMEMSANDEEASDDCAGGDATRDLWLTLDAAGQKSTTRASDDERDFVPQLHLRVEFVPSHEVLRRFWKRMVAQFDTDDNGKINRIEFGALVEALGVEISEADMDAAYGGESGDRELAPDAVYRLISEQCDWAPGVPVQCPVCSVPLSFAGDDRMGAVSHVALCSEGSSDGPGQILTGGLLTEAYASRGWLSRIGNYLSGGRYGIGAVSGNILVQDRLTGAIVEEKMPVFIRVAIRLMYHTNMGDSTVRNSRVQRIMARLTEQQGTKFDNPSSVSHIRPFIKFHNLDTDEMADTLDSFKTFNEFFYRKLKPGARQLADPDPHVAISPADSRCVVFQTVDDATRVWIKGKHFSVEALVGGPKLAAPFRGGSVAIFRLAPQDYHRFHMPVDGIVGHTLNIPGKYYTVNPMAVRQNVDVFTENKRTVTFIDSDVFGRVAYVCIGAMMVGSVILTSKRGARVSRIDEHGHFAFGGSTVVILFPADKICFDRDLLKNSAEGLETLVRVGMSIGRTPSSSSG
eukprot:Opistho-2@94946